MALILKENKTFIDKFRNTSNDFYACVNQYNGINISPVAEAGYDIVYTNEVLEALEAL